MLFAGMILGGSSFIDGLRMSEGCVDHMEVVEGEPTTSESNIDDDGDILLYN